MTDWKQGYRRGSTVFKEDRKKDGEISGYTCVLCGERYRDNNDVFFDIAVYTHETMHLLQKLLAIQSGKTDGLIFEGENEG